MVSLRLISLVFITLGCRELASGEPQSVPWITSLAALGVSLGFGLLFRAAALRTLIQSDGGYGPDCWEQSRLARERIELAWLATLPAALLVTGWGQSLNLWQAQGLPQAVALLGWFLPSLLLIVLLELTAAQLDELVGSSGQPLQSLSPSQLQVALPPNYPFLPNLPSAVSPSLTSPSLTSPSLAPSTVSQGQPSQPSQASAVTPGQPSAVSPGQPSAVSPGQPSAVSPGLSAVSPGLSAMSPGLSAMSPGLSAMSPGLESASPGWGREWPASWPQEWMLRLRLGELSGLVTCIAPLLVIATVTDLLSWVADDVWVSRCVVGGTLLSLVGVVLYLPVWLGKWMGVGELPSCDLRERLESHCRGLRIRGLKACWLSSRGRWSGAAIVGWFPRFRQLWLGDALLERLSYRQLDMVIMHELAHIRRYHFLWRLFPMVWAVGVIALFGMCWPVDPGWQWMGSVLSGGTASLVLVGGLRVMAHACELDADRSACALARQVCPWAVQQWAAPEKELSNALSALLNDSPTAAAASWLHPSLRKRLDNLQNRSIPSRQPVPQHDCADMSNVDATKLKR